MKNFMFNSNAKKKISITSAVFSLLILFFALNCSFCGNLCSAEYSGTDDGHEETTTEIKTPKEGEEDENENNEEDKKDDETNQQENNEENDKNDNSQAEKDEQPSEEQESKGKDLCPFSCLLV